MRRSDPVSSQEAAASPRQFPWPVLFAACKWREFSDEMLHEKVGGQRSVVARRRLDLEEHGLVEQILDRAGRPIFGVSSAGRKVRLSRVTPLGIETMRQELQRRGQL